MDKVPDVKRILVVHQRRLGDMVLATPVLRLLGKTYPEASLAFVCEEVFAGLLEAAPGVDRVLGLPDLRVDPVRRWWRRRRFGLARRAEGYDLAVDLRCSMDTAVVTHLSAARVRVGRAYRNHGFAYNRLAGPPVLPPGVHLRDFLLNTARAAGCDTSGEDVAPRLHVTEAAARAARGRTGTAKYALLQVGSSRDYKCWPLDRFAELARWLDREKGLKTLVHAGPGEEPRARGVVGSAPDASQFYRSASLAELAAVLKNAEIVTGNDSGPMHMAGAVGTPLVAFFGTADPDQWAPLGERRVILRSPRADDPSADRNELMPDISLDQALEAADSLLSGKGGQSR